MEGRTPPRPYPMDVASRFPSPRRDTLCSGMRIALIVTSKAKTLACKRYLPRIQEFNEIHVDTKL